MIRPDTSGLFRLFVYGTLKRGYSNHEAYCGSAISVEDAAVWGLLHELPSGIPVLEVPECDIIAHGSANIPGDAALQHCIEVNLSGYPECGGVDWKQIEGELISLPEPVITVPPIDRLEGFCPDGASLYRRILVPARQNDECVTVAWCYVAGSTAARALTPTSLIRWG